MQDLEDDALAGVKSSARRLGAAAPRAVMAFYAISVAPGPWRPGGWPGSGVALPAAGVALFAVHLARQALRSCGIGDPAGALAIFKSNTLAGLCCSPPWSRAIGGLDAG